MNSTTKREFSTKKMVLYAVLLTLGVALHIIEAALPINFVFGLKLGLANIVTLVACYLLGIKPAISLSIARVIFASLLSGTILSSTFILSMSGALSSAIVMALSVTYSKIKNVPIISIFASIAHNVGQVVAFIIISSTRGMIFYLPYLIALSIPTGYFVGLCSEMAILALIKANAFYKIDSHRGFEKTDKNKSWKLLAVSVGLIILISIWVPKIENFGKESKPSDTVLVTFMAPGEGEELFRVKPDEIERFIDANTDNGLLRVNGSLGVSELEVDSDKGIRFISSPCRDKTCVKLGWVKGENDFAVCLPNEIFVTVE